MTDIAGHRITNRSLFDVEDQTTMPKVRDMTVAPVSVADVQEFGQRYHYTATGGNATWRWGLWHGVTLLGVVAYNLPTRETCESVFGGDHFDKVWHMGRLALAESAPRNSESRLIAGSLRAIHLQHPHVWGVLTYAATDAGHIGYVYQATNALYTGTGGHAVVYIDLLRQRVRVPDRGGIARLAGTRRRRQTPLPVRTREQDGATPEDAGATPPGAAVPEG